MPASVLSGGMATELDVLDTMRLVAERTGDPTGWQAGLSPQEIIDLSTPFTPSRQLDAILARIRQHHPEVFNPPSPPQPPADRADGAAARAIADAEAALAHQNSVSSQLDLQVISAILNAHLTTAEGKDALDKLQRDVETALATRSDLDTAAGARDFQRYLIGKLRDIRAVVANASLDDTSKSALMAAWISLYNASKDGGNAPDGRRPASQEPAPTRGSSPSPTASPTAPSAGADPLDSLLLDDPGLFGAPVQQPATAIPPAGGTASPAGGAGPANGASLPSLGTPSGLSLPNLSGGGTGRDPRAHDDALFDDWDPREHKPDHKDTEDDEDHKDDDSPDPEAGRPESPPSGPTTVTLPNGETVTAASPQLAAAIKAAAGGAPIPDAFAQQGMTIPAAGTPVSNPLDAAQVAPGDIGMFTDRHALALGGSKALLDGQIQHISVVTGPSFLGWEHPPTPVSVAATPEPKAPTPTRPAAALSVQP